VAARRTAPAGADAIKGTEEQEQEQEQGCQASAGTGILPTLTHLQVKEYDHAV
jgi:hypothetical protein